jgi:hypothetical protein
MSAAERDDYYHRSPAFWSQAAAVDGSDGLWKLDSDIFSGKPYNNILQFGDSLLLVGEASYRSFLDGGLFGQGEGSGEYEFSFDVYSPWYNRITASLSHSEVSCTSYQVCDGSLFLLDSAAMTLARYDSSLNENGTFGLSAFEDIDSLVFYPSGEEDTCFLADGESGGLDLLRFSGDSVVCTPVSLPYYDARVLYASPDDHTLTLLGVSEETLQEKIVRLDTDSLAVLAEYPCTDAADTLSASGMTFLPSGSILLRESAQDAASSHSISTFSYYDGSGNGIATVSYDLGDYSAESGFGYLSQDAAMFEEEALGFFLVYNSDCEPSLLVWDYSTPISGMEPLDIPYMGQDADDAVSGDGASGTDIDWGSLTELRARADELEEQYGIEILFGQQLPEEIGIYRIAPCTDEELISEGLDTLSKSLDCYPGNFFPQLCLGETTGITICLTGAITSNTEGMLGSPTGFLDTADDRLVMVLSMDYLWDWDYTISHEISHMIDQRLEYRAVYVADSLFSEETWASYNPDGCTYLNTYENYEENEQYDTYSDYFADAYGMTYATEDRAELFGLAMSDYLGSFDEDLFFQDDAPTTEKYRYYCACIRDGFDTDGWDKVMPWEAILEK